MSLSKEVSPAPLYENLEVVLSLSELRGFPDLPEGSYKMSASLEGVTLETEEMLVFEELYEEDEEQEPYFFDEALCWKMDVGTLASLRRDKTPITLKVFYEEEEMGHLSLDLESSLDFPSDNKDESLGGFFVDEAKWARFVIEEGYEFFLKEYRAIKYLITIRSPPRDYKDGSPPTCIQEKKSAPLKSILLKDKVSRPCRRRFKPQFTLYRHFAIRGHISEFQASSPSQQILCLSTWNEQSNRRLFIEGRSKRSRKVNAKRSVTHVDKEESSNNSSSQSPSDSDPKISEEENGSSPSSILSNTNRITASLRSLHLHNGSSKSIKLRFSVSTDREEVTDGSPMDVQVEQVFCLQKPSLYAGSCLKFPCKVKPNKRLQFLRKTPLTPLKA